MGKVIGIDQATLDHIGFAFFSLATPDHSLIYY